MSRPFDEDLARWLEIVEQMEVGLHVYHLEDPEDDRTLRFIGANRAAERIAGVPREVLIGTTIDACFPGLRDRGLPQAYAQVARTGVPWQVDEFVYGDARVIKLAYAVRAVPLPHTCVGIIFEDATARLRAEGDLRRSEARQRALLDALPDVMYRVRPDGSLLDVRRGTDGPDALAVAVRAHLVTPLHVGDVRMFEVQQDGVDLELRLLRTAEDELLAIVRDISERKQAERRKDEFVSVVSHELRTPLTSIHGALGLLSGGVLGEVPPVMGDLVKVARSNTERLVRLINDMLDLDKMEAGGVQLELVPVDAVALADAAIEEMRGAAESAGVHLRRVVVRGGSVLGDRDRLIQVLTNLISNAVRYSPPQAAVVVTVSNDGERVRFLVSDEGPGIPADRVAHLFRKFTQLGSGGDARRRGGTGLGLAISKAIVDSHGGSIGFLPRAPGASFYVDLAQTLPPVPQPDLFSDLRLAYGAALPGQVEDLAHLVEAGKGARADAISLAHRLHGTAGTYGYWPVSHAAGELDGLLRADAEPDVLAAAVAVLRRACVTG